METTQLQNSFTERNKSVSNEKVELHDIDTSILALENRLKCMRIQKQRKD
jgi:predicted  nucleic acid-binding Zn-ribbon protein